MSCYNKPYRWEINVTNYSTPWAQDFIDVWLKKSDLKQIRWMVYFIRNLKKNSILSETKKNLLSSLRERHSSKWWRQCFCIHFTSSSWKYIFRLWSRNSKIFYFTQTHLVNNHFARPPCLDSAKINKIKMKQEYLETFRLFTLYVFIVYLSEVREGAEDVMNRIWTKTDRTDTSWSYIQNRDDAFNRKFHKNRYEYHH